MKATLIIGNIGLIISGFLVINIKDFILKILSCVFVLFFIYLIAISNSTLLTCISFPLQMKIILGFLFSFSVLLILNTVNKTVIDYLDKIFIIVLSIFMFLGELIVYYFFPVQLDWIINIFLLGRILECISLGLFLLLLIRYFLHKKNIDEVKFIILYIIYFVFNFAFWDEIHKGGIMIID